MQLCQETDVPNTSWRWWGARQNCNWWHSSVLFPMPVRCLAHHELLSTLQKFCHYRWPEDSLAATDSWLEVWMELVIGSPLGPMQLHSTTIAREQAQFDQSGIRHHPTGVSVKSSQEKNLSCLEPRWREDSNWKPHIPLVRNHTGVS